MAGKSKKDRGIVDDGLNEESIIRTARKIVGESGVAGLTMRRLSDDLGVALGATYHYVPNRQTLLRLVAQNIYEDLDLPSASRGDWKSQVHVALVRFVRLISPYKGLAHELALDPTGMNPQELQRFLRERLSAAGFGPKETAVVMSSLFFYVAGATLTDGQQLAPRHFETGLRFLLDGAEASQAN